MQMQTLWINSRIVATCLAVILCHLAGQVYARECPLDSDQPSAANENVDSWLDDNMAPMSKMYLHLHRNPEVSFHEKETAAFVADRWREAGFEVTTGIGGHGIVGIMKNGDGPTVMLRTDLDALPLEEKTGVPYASTATFTKEDGSQTGVMHACGHDIHMTNLTGTARYLADNKDAWSGTLMLVGQPAEERGAGAKAMLEEGLFEKFPKPDFAVALHVSSDLPTGTVGFRSGYALANVDSVDITIKGRGGHGSKPETTIDPIMQAGELVVSLQTIVSREINPQDPAVVTIGSIHGGTKHNIIGDECKLQLTVRSYSPEVRKHLLEAIERKAKAVAMGANAPEPDVVVSEGTPSLFNDEALCKRMTPVFESVVGKEKLIETPMSMGGEDFSQYGIKGGVPIFMYALGTVSERRLNRFKESNIPPPSLHSSIYYPDFEDSLRVGVKTMSAAALELFGK